MTSKKTILLFSGQGSQAVGMGRDLGQDFIEFRQTVEEASDTLGYDMSKLLWEDPSSQLNLTEFTQPAIVTMSTGIFRILRERAGVQATLVAGHSLGEYSALTALGALAFADALRAVRFRGQAMQKAVPVGLGAMAAYIGQQCDAVAELCQAETKPEAVVEPVNFNSPSQLVLSGHKVGVERVAAIISERKLGKARMLPVSAPFHSSLMKPAADAMNDYLGSVVIHEFAGQIVANINAEIYSSPKYTKEHLVKQVASAVLWTQSLHKMQKAEPDALWVEVGPGAVLQGLAKATLPGCEPLVTGNVDALRNVLSKF